MSNKETKTDLAKGKRSYGMGMTHVKVLNLVAICRGSIQWTGWGLFVWSVLQEHIPSQQKQKPGAKAVYSRSAQINNTDTEQGGLPSTEGLA